jgi:DNA-directed RNA polymerase specialized sigma subunit
MVADYVSVTREVPAEKIRVTITDIDPGAGLTEALADARQAQADAVLAQEKAAARVRALAKALVERGLSGVEIALVLGVSKQRVSQLTAAPTTTVLTSGPTPIPKALSRRPA